MGRRRVRPSGDRATAAVVTLGCPKNLVDSEVMAALLGSCGHVLTDDPKEADVVVINTCAFIGPAREEAWAEIGEAAELRRSGRCRALVVAGCLAQGFGDEVSRRFPEVDALVGTGEVDKIIEAVERVTTSGPAQGDVIPGPGIAHGKSGGRAADAPRAIPGYVPVGPAPRLLGTPLHYAYLKIAEGCDHRCAFCLIPSLRGPYRSRPLKDLIAEAQGLEGLGVRELVLVAQDTTAYGHDLEGRPMLADLVRGLLRETGLPWLRVLYGHPAGLTEEFVDLLGEHGSDLPDGTGRLCRYLDLPMQHASDRILKNMRRPETRESLTALVADLRRRVPGLTLRSSFIVGLPGETDKDFNELMGFIREVKLERAGFFTYSREATTGAAAMPGQVDEGVKEERLTRVLELQRRISLERGRMLVGSTLRVLLDEVERGWGGGSSGRVRARCGGARLVARGERDAPEIDGRVLVRDLREIAGARPFAEARRGQFMKVKVVGAKAYDLLAEPLGDEARLGPGSDGSA